MQLRWFLVLWSSPQWQHLLSDIISRNVPMFFLSQISLHKSLQHEQRTDERGKLISSAPCSLSCIPTADITCTHSHKGMQGDFYRFCFSLKHTGPSHSCRMSPLRVCFSCYGSVHERAVSCSELSKMLIKREGEWGGNLLLELLWHQAWCRMTSLC